jgi:predicted kinase
VDPNPVLKAPFLATYGLPRSGKSTICREVYLPMGYTIVTPDNFRLALHGERYNPKMESWVWAMVTVAIDALLLSGNKVILDATNLLKERRKPWVDRGAQFVLVNTPAEECIRRAKAMNDYYIVSVIEAMAAKAESLQAGEPVIAVHRL